MPEQEDIKQEEKIVSEDMTETPTPGWMWIKNSKGQPSATLTFVTTSFFIVAMSYIASMFVSIGPIQLRAFDAGACSAFFIPLLGLYGARRYTEKKFEK
jgi:hypothetical protein